MTYKAPLRDISFILEHITPVAELAALEPFAHADPAMVEGLLGEAARFCEQAVAPTNVEGDQQGSRLIDGSVKTPDSFPKLYEQYVAAGWGSLAHTAELGGGNFPLLVANVFKEFLNSANMAFSLGPLLTTGAVEMLEVHASDEQKQVYVTKMISGEWTGTMNLTEPHAGSDVGALTSKAIPAGDGTYRITGNKIFITYGDHDMTEQIVHLVLARTPDAPVGTKGISCFIVPKYLVNDDGSLGERNDAKVVSIEHKLGIHASPTCVMAFGEEGEGAIGYLIGQENEGMRYMFTMMNDARLGVGIQGLAIAERAYQLALAYALDRTQGRAPGAAKGASSPIIQHPDVRRMLLTMKAYIESLRAMCYANAFATDLAKAHPDPETRRQNQMLADLLTPLSKGWGTDLGVELASIGIQIHGGMGYVEETGAAQHYRDARIAPIYEGTNGIQALDLVGRKLPYDGGAFVKGFLAERSELAANLSAGDGDLAVIGERLAAGIATLQQATDHIFANAGNPLDVFAGATPYARMFAQVVGGAFLAKQAQVAAALLAKGEGDKSWLEGKIATAKFFADQLLPMVDGLLASVLAPAEQLFALTDEQFAS
jgi:alkylation response protein AidB-like acyl-CoA dehydrogenase